MANIYGWVGGSGSDLETLANWVESTDGGTTFVAATSLPTAADTVLVDGTASVFGNTAAYWLEFNADQNSNYKVTVTAPSNWTVATGTYIGVTSGDTVVINAPVILSASANGLKVGWDAPGTLTIDAGGSLTTASDIFVGNTDSMDGNGTLNVITGGTLNSTGAINLIGGFGTFPGGDYYVYVKGAGSTWNTNGEPIYVEGTLQIAHGGTVFASDIWGYGILSMQTGGTLITSGGSQIGVNGDGEASITGAGATWTSRGFLELGTPSGGPTTAPGVSFLVETGAVVQQVTEAYSFDLWGNAGIYVDSSSVLEIGSAGGAKIGGVTVDPGAQLWGSGSIGASVIDNGDIFASDAYRAHADNQLPDSLTVSGSITGIGALLIGEGATLTAKGAVSGVTARFKGYLGDLVVGSGFASDVTGFMPTDSIDFSALKYAGTSDTYSYANGVLTVTEGANSQQINVATQNLGTLSGALQLSADSSGGTTVTFSAAADWTPFNLWGGDASNIFTTSSGAVAGQLWGATNVVGGDDPIVIDNYTAQTTYVAGQAATFNIALTTFDFEGDQQNLLPVASVTEVNPFGAAGNIAGVATFSSSSSTGLAAVVYWAPSSISGAYDLAFQNASTDFVTSPSAGPNTTLTGAPSDIITGVTALSGWAFATSSANLVYAYATTTGEPAGSENIVLQAFNTSGAATTSAATVATGISTTTSNWFVTQTGGTFYFEDIVGGELVKQTFDPTTGALGAAANVLKLYYSAVFAVGEYQMNSGRDFVLVEGLPFGSPTVETVALYDQATGQAVWSRTVTGTAPDKVSYATLADPNDSNSLYTVVATVDAGAVHLDLLDEQGRQIGSDFVVPGLTSFDRIRAMGRRVFIDYTVTNADGSQQIQTVIYDTTGAATTETLSGGPSEVIGTPFNDVFTWGAGVYTVDGGGGNDTFDASMFSATQVSISVNAAGDLVFSDGKGDVDTLRRFSEIDLSDATIQISGATRAYRIDNSFVTLVGGGDSVEFSGGAGGAASLINAASAWDVVTSASGATGTVYLTGSGASIYGGGDTVDFWSGAGDVASLINATGAWDVVTSSNGTTGTVYLTNAGASIVGGGDTVDFWSGTGDVASLINATSAWDVVNSSNGTTGTVYLTHAGASIAGGGDAIVFWGGSDNAASLINAASAWDTVTSANGATGTVYLSNAGVSIYGGGDTVEFWSGSSNVASLINATSAWDVVNSANGATGTVYLSSAGASIYGGGDTVDFWSGANNAASLLNTGGVSDTVTASNGATGTIYLSDANASVSGGGDTIDFWSGVTNSVSLSGAHYALSFHQAAFGLDTVKGFTSGESLTFALADQGHLTITQSGANTLITRDAGDVVTLTNVQASSVSLSQLHFA